MTTKKKKDDRICCECGLGFDYGDPVAMDFWWSLEAPLLMHENCYFLKKEILQNIVDKLPLDEKHVKLPEKTYFFYLDPMFEVRGKTSNDRINHVYTNAELYCERYC